MPKISAILPTYNGERFIRQAIESCLLQSWTDFELIIINDASTDATANIVSSYQDKRIILFHHSENKKLPAALNTGFHHAQGDYFIWMADDDYWAPDAFIILADYLDQHPEVDGAYADYCRMDENGNFIERISLDHQNPDRPLNTHAFLYRREVFHTLGGYNLNCFLVEDYEFWLRACARYQIYYVPTDHPLYHLRDRPGSLTDRYRWKVHEMSARLRREILGISWLEYRRQMAYVPVQAAYMAYREQNYIEVQRRFWQAIFRNPLWVLNRGFLSISIQSLLKITRGALLRQNHS